MSVPDEEVRRAVVARIIALRTLADPGVVAAHQVDAAAMPQAARRAFARAAQRKSFGPWPSAHGHIQTAANR